MHSSSWKYFLGADRQDLVNYFGNKCNKCGKTYNHLVIHHKDKTGYFTLRKLSIKNFNSKINNNIDNLELLCKKCHASKHSQDYKQRSRTYTKDGVIAYSEWSKKYDKCLQCGTTDIKHKCYGYCEKCWDSYSTLPNHV